MAHGVVTTTSASNAAALAIPTACTILFVKMHSVAAYIPESNANPVTPREPKFTKRGEDLSG